MILHYLFLLNKRASPKIRPPDRRPLIYILQLDELFLLLNVGAGFMPARK
jgi:hypothetical protein